MADWASCVLRQKMSCTPFNLLPNETQSSSHDHRAASCPADSSAAWERSPQVNQVKQVKHGPSSPQSPSCQQMWCCWIRYDKLKTHSDPAAASCDQQKQCKQLKPQMLCWHGGTWTREHYRTRGLRCFFKKFWHDFCFNLHPSFKQQSPGGVMKQQTRWFWTKEMI